MRPTTNQLAAEVMEAYRTLTISYRHALSVTIERKGEWYGANHLNEATTRLNTAQILYNQRRQEEQLFGID